MTLADLLVIFLVGLLIYFGMRYFVDDDD